MFSGNMSKTSAAASVAIGGDDNVDHCDDRCSDDEGNGVKSAGSGNESIGTTQSSFSLITQRIVELAKEETCYVWSLKTFIMLVLAFAGAFVARTTHRLLTANAERDFEEAFTDLAQTMIAESSLRTKFINSTLNSMSVAISSNTKQKEVGWPFVTIPHFEVRGRDAIREIGLESLLISPLVSEERRHDWEQYSVANQAWIQDGLDYRGEQRITTNITQYIHTGDGITREPGPANPFYTPIWQIAPAPLQSNEVNRNLISSNSFSLDLEVLTASNSTAMSKILPTTEATPEPKSLFYRAIREDTAYTSNVVGFLVATLPWNIHFKDRLPTDTPEGVILVLTNTCNQTYTYRIDGPNVTLLGEGDLHDPSFDYMQVSSADFGDNEIDIVEGSSFCWYNIILYPTKNLRDQFETISPLVFTCGVVSVFFLSMICFVIYDSSVERRQEKNANAAERSDVIVRSLFPKHVRDHLMQRGENSTDDLAPLNPLSDKTNKENPGDIDPVTKKPIADLFPHCTVMFADIVGFTAWSSAREPSEVFTLLESVYRSFDVIAHRRGVFKVETIGDCYVAVCGLPEPRRRHAAVMARFASDCLFKMKDVVNSMELYLGPDTADLTMRFGLNSGPVIAGVLRGEKSRFQLFGDTVNTAARMESSGERDRIHMSQDTADCLTALGKGSWALPRELLITAKGKGEMQTYWLDVEGGLGSNTTSSAGDNKSIFGGSCLNESRVEIEGLIQPIQLKGKNQSLANWMLEILSRDLKRICSMYTEKNYSKRYKAAVSSAVWSRMEGSVLDEVKEIITFPQKPLENPQDFESMELDPIVTSQLRHYVTTVASMYRDVPFHSFERASHITMSATKLLARVVAHNDIQLSTKKPEKMHKTSFGIASDPLAQFAVTFIGLIRHVDHTGVSNATLAQEDPALAAKFNKTTIVEQKSLNLAWNLLLEPTYEDLRNCICRTMDEQQRFRQIVINGMMATDFSNKGLVELRRKRWNEAFVHKPMEEDINNVINRKATILIELLIQTSHLAHSMQHWHIYQKWNAKLFEERIAAYTARQSDKDPSEGWYEAELGFFDSHVIPLAKKVKESGFFGVSSDQYLNYALDNRMEWEEKGKAILAGYVPSYS